MSSTSLKPVESKPGLSLYISVKNAMLETIRAGHFKAGERLPSTKQLSQQFSVSLVTMHRALQDLEARGVLDRVQGRGTFVTDHKGASARKSRLGLILQPQASLADFYHGQLLEGMNRVAREEGADLLILQYEQKLQADCQGYFLINQLPEAIDEFCAAHPADTPLLVVGARHQGVPYVDVNNTDLIQQAVRHVHRLGHRRIGYLGGAGELSNSRDRQEGFVKTCNQLNIPESQQHRLNAESWRLNEQEKMAFSQLLAGPNRPTAVIAGGYYLALEVYNVANTLGLSVPGQLTVVGVDDPPSAAHLFPPLTTLRQPLFELGYAAVNRLISLVNEGPSDHPNQNLKADLIIRESSGAPPTSPSASH